jgi:hypothetical protein
VTHTSRSDAHNEAVSRSEATTRSWAKIGGAALAVVMVAVGLVGGTRLLSDSQHDSSAPATLPQPQDGMRWEFYSDIRVQVPSDWGYASEPGSDWCATAPDRLPRDPYVALNRGGIVLGIGCLGQDSESSSEPPTSMWEEHVKVAVVGDDDEAGTTQRDNWWIVKRVVGDVMVKVVSKDQELAQQIVATAERVTDDSSGCAPHSQIEDEPFPRPVPAFDVAQLEDVDSITVCQYGIGDISQPGLTAVASLDGQQADDELAALQSAPVGGGPDRPTNCMPDDPGDSAIELLFHSRDVVHSMYVFYSTCHGNGFDDGTAIRELTTDACLPLIKPPVAIWHGSTPTVERCLARSH